MVNPARINRIYREKERNFHPTNYMSEVNIEIKSVVDCEDIQRWENHMLVKAKCWNQFCCYSNCWCRLCCLVSEHALRRWGTHITCVDVDAEKKWYYTYL